MNIDSLTHILPKEISEEIDRFKKLDKKFTELFDEKTKISQAEELIGEIKKNNIDKVVVGGFGWSSDEITKMVNEYILDSKNIYDEIIPVCSVNLYSKNPELELLNYIDKGAKGVGELHLNYDEEIENNKILINTLKIALEYNLPTIIHGSEPVGHTYPGKGRNLPEKLYSLAKKNPSNKFIFSHFGGGLVFYEHMPEVKEALRNVYYDSAAQPFLYDKKIYNNAINSSNIKKILFASDYPLINIKRCLSQLSDLSEDEKNHILSYNPISVFNL